MKLRSEKIMSGPALTELLQRKIEQIKYRVTTAAISYIVAICKQQKLLNFLLDRNCSIELFRS